MTDLFLPSLTSKVKEKQSLDSKELNQDGEKSAQQSIYNSRRAENPTWAWVRSLPSPSNKSFPDSFESRPESRRLETPCFLLEDCKDDDVGLPPDNLEKSSGLFGQLENYKWSKEKIFPDLPTHKSCNILSTSETTKKTTFSDDQNKGRQEVAFILKGKSRKLPKFIDED